MPRKTLRKLLPDLPALLARPSLGWLKGLASDPNLLHINRQSVSLAVFIGVFCAFLPLPVQTIIAALLALWWRANFVISVILVWISNPITIPPIFYLNYTVGSWLLGTAPSQHNVTLSWEWFNSVGSHILLPLGLGSLVVALLIACTSYCAVFWLWRWKVVRNWQRRQQQRQK